MATYLIACKFAPHTPGSLATLERKTRAKLKSLCPNVEVKARYALLGPYDTLYIVEAPENHHALEAAMVLRSVGHASTEIWPAVESNMFDTLSTTFTRRSQQFEEAFDPVDESLEESFPASDAPSWIGGSVTPSEE
nr:GYD domain-containing protein [Ardenticatena sp.]